MTAPLISSQRYLNDALVLKKAKQFSVFIVHAFETSLRGQNYRVLIDGHHNYAAAKLVNEPVTFRPPPKKFMRIISKYSKPEIEKFLINNLTDSDYYFIETGKTVEELKTLA